MKIVPLHWSALDDDRRILALDRPEMTQGSIGEEVEKIIARVREGGDNALAELTRALDGVKPAALRVSREKLTAASARCDASLLDALTDAESRIRRFHQAFIPAGGDVTTAEGLTCSLRYEALDPVGLYVPGGSAPLVSTVLMLGVPANLAGCRNVVMCTPPGKNGRIAPEVIAAAELCGIRQVFCVGGAQAIAAMAYGTETLPRCSKIFGPGNAWVTAAKEKVALDPAGAAIDMPAGPSEVVVIADRSADSVSVAWDLLSQAEHGPDSQVILFTDSAALAEAVADAVSTLSENTDRRTILEHSLAAARIIVVDDLPTAIDLSNRYAPEHLIINTENARGLARKARNAGSIFLGPWTPESLGDYCSGTNHVLPTNGWARSYAGLSVADFMRRFTVQEANFEALTKIGPTAERLAAFEGLDAHRMAVRHRLNEGARP